MWAELLAVAGLAVNIAIGSIASNNRIQSLVAVLALEALAMPLSTLGEDLFGGEDYTTATGTALARRGLDDGGINNRCLRRGFSVY